MGGLFRDFRNGAKARALGHLQIRREQAGNKQRWIGDIDDRDRGRLEAGIR